MKITLKRLREKKGMKLETLSKLCDIKVRRLKDIEEYRTIPDGDEIISILKILGIYYDEILFFIWEKIKKTLLLWKAIFPQQKGFLYD